MNKPELLSPAGNFECLKAAIEAGCDAVYIGGKLFGARAFCNNFSDEEIIKAICYAHLYGVKVYVTMNTLVYERETKQFLSYVDFLYRNNADAIIIQDIGMMDLIRKTYPDLELHASTQMHIHNEEGIHFVETLGLKRAVLARETSIDTISKIKENTHIELEIFVHGALCISYSGQCLMSSLIGHRSGNRGSCAGSCRQKYNVIADGKKVNKEEYLLSTKDLNSLENIGKLMEIGIASVKIEGRMKSAAYVYMVTKLYRKAIDSYYQNKKVEISETEIEQLQTIFNRRYTKGFLGNANNNDIIHSYRPNHLGIRIGTVIKTGKGEITIQLTKPLSVGDGIRILGKEDFGFTVTSLHINDKKVERARANDIVKIPCKEEIQMNSHVVKTTDIHVLKEIQKQMNNPLRKVMITGKASLKIGKPISLQLSDGIRTIEVTGGIVEKALNQPVLEAKIKEQLQKLGNTVYSFNTLEIEKDKDIFISLKELNEIRRNAVEKLNLERCYQSPYRKEKYDAIVPNYQKLADFSVSISDKSQYVIIQDDPITTIYADFEINDSRYVRKLERVMDTYPSISEPLLVGELGSVFQYQNISTDWSLNVTNSYAVAFLHEQGVNRITLSYELTNTQIEELINSYVKRYHAKPNLEFIVFGKEEAMISKYNINQTYQVKNSYLEDRFHNAYPIVIKNNRMHIYHYQRREKLEFQKYFDMGISHLRFLITDDEDLKRYLEIKKKLNDAQIEIKDA